MEIIYYIFNIKYNLLKFVKVWLECSVCFCTIPYISIPYIQYIDTIYEYCTIYTLYCTRGHIEANH